MVEALTAHKPLPHPLRKHGKASRESSNINSYLLKEIGGKFMSSYIVKDQIPKELHNKYPGIRDVWPEMLLFVADIVAH